MILKQPKCLMITQILMKCPIYKIDLEIKNTSRNKSKIEEVGNQVSNIVDFVDKVEESLTQKPQQKKCYKRYRTEESRKQRDIENHLLLSGCSSTCLKQC